MDRPGLHARHWRWTCAAPGAHWGGWGGSTKQPKDQYLRSNTPMGQRPGEFKDIWVAVLAKAVRIFEDIWLAVLAKAVRIFEGIWV